MTEEQRRRLRASSVVTGVFTEPVLRSEMAKRDSRPVIVDLNCGDTAQMQSLLKDKVVKAYLGITGDVQLAKKLNELSAGMDNVLYQAADVTATNFVDEVAIGLGRLAAKTQLITDKLESAKADILILPMTLQFVTNPVEFLEAVKPLMKKDGVVISVGLDVEQNKVSDSDDAAMVMHAGELFGRRYVSKDTVKVVQWLKAAGYTNPRFARGGLTTDHMNSLRQPIYDAYFDDLNECCIYTEDKVWSAAFLPKVKAVLLDHEKWFTLALRAHVAQVAGA